MSADYTVKLNIFEGPLDLLLHLIKANELEITEISISQITGSYLEYLRLMETFDLEVAGDFLVMAATLINIKLRSILPEPEEEIEEDQTADEGDDFLTARALMQRLIEYRKFKEAAQNLGRSADRQSLIFVREVALPSVTQAEADPAIRGDLNLLLEAFSRVINYVQRRDYHQVQEEEYTIEDKILALRRRLLIEDRISVVDLLGLCRVKVEMIVMLIAMLELCRLKELTVTQAGPFGDILIIRRHGNISDELSTAPTGAAEQLAQLEASIMAERTGLVDDGQSAEDAEDALIDSILAEEIPKVARGRKGRQAALEIAEQASVRPDASEQVSPKQVSPKHHSPDVSPEVSPDLSPDLSIEPSVSGGQNGEPEPSPEPVIESEAMVTANPAPELPEALAEAGGGRIIEMMDLTTDRPGSESRPKQQDDES